MPGRPVWQTCEWGFTHARKLFRCRGSDCTCPTFYATSPLLLLRGAARKIRLYKSRNKVWVSNNDISLHNLRNEILVWGILQWLPLYTGCKKTLMMITAVNPIVYKWYFQYHKHELILILCCNWFFSDEMFTGRCQTKTRFNSCLWNWSPSRQLHEWARYFSAY